ncbi:copper resistance protein CopC [Actinoplanes sp. NPDC049265]|uniref:copper resistance CopC family protein n=1 Tax=Actinoplanes sp. NPDC049265 TaxID=3363902 RepID=UPI00371D7CEB
MRIARIVTAALAATVVAVVSTGTPALAHNSLIKAVPAKNATVKESPASVELSFLEEPLKLTIEVVDAQHQKAAASGPSVKGKTGVLALTDPLANGTYSVRWSLVSDDGDPIKGTYKFTVDSPATPSPSPSVSSAALEPAPAATSATPVAADEGSSSGWIIAIIAIIAVVLVVAAGAIFLARRRKTAE